MNDENRLYVIEHSGFDKNEWFIWSSHNPTSEEEAHEFMMALNEKVSGALLKFRVTKYIRAPEL